MPAFSSNLASWLFVANIGFVHCLVAWHAVTMPEALSNSDTPTALVEHQDADSNLAVTTNEDIGQKEVNWLEKNGLPGSLDLSKVYQDGLQYWADLENGWSAELTTMPKLQKRAVHILNRAKVPFGAVVVLDLASSDVLVMADRYDEAHEASPSLTGGGPPHLALRNTAPSASVFKIVTAAALLEKGLPIHQKRGYIHATRRITKKHLGPLVSGALKSDLGLALATSNNGFFARETNRLLTQQELLAAAQNFGFNRVVPFPLLTDASVARIPTNPLERSRVAAGFWKTYLTPMHGALIAAAVAKDGQLPTPRLVKRLHTADGRKVDAPKRPAIGRAMSADTARQLRTVMSETSKRGTARRAFSKWPKRLRHIRVGGKTGSLSKRDPYTGYTWFVGYAPVDDPKVAISVMVGNGELWWQKAADVARDVLTSYFDEEARRTLAVR